MNQIIKLIDQETFGTTTQSKLNCKIEYCGRVCYNSRDKITPDSNKNFVEGLTKAKHLSVLEHGEVILKWRFFKNIFDAYNITYHLTKLMCPFRIILSEDKQYFFIITNYRYYIENPELFYNCEIIDSYEFSDYELNQYNQIKRVTFEVNTEISITRELNRHRCLSISEMSTRYVDFTNNLHNDEPYWAENIKNEFERKDILDYYNTSFAISKYAYNYLLTGCNLKKQDVRAIIPLGTYTTAVYTAFKDCWKDIINKRYEIKGSHPVMVQLIKQIKNELQF